MHVVSLFATIVVTAGLVVPAWWYGSEASADTKPAEPIQIALHGFGIDHELLDNLRQPNQCEVESDGGVGRIHPLYRRM